MSNLKYFWAISKFPTNVSMLRYVYDDFTHKLKIY